MAARKGKRVRRARGTGTVFERPGGGWTGRKWVGGTRIERKGKTLGEVLAKLDAATPPGENATVGQWAARWRAGWQVRSRTRKNYSNYLDHHILPRLGAARLRDLTPGRAERLAAELTDDDLAVNTVLGVLRVLGTMLRAAVREGLIPTNPVAAAKKPRSERPEIRPFTAAEVDRIVAACDTPQTAPIAVLATTGMRAGEALGLDVTDYQPKAGLLSISRTYSDRTLGPPKTPQGVRVIRAPLAARPALELARGSRTTGPLFVTEAGSRRDAGSLAAAWRAVLRRAGLAYRNPHQLRHTAATLMLAAGDHAGDVAKYLGDRPETIYDTYVHATGADPSLTMDRLLGGVKVAGKGKKCRRA